jgi:hypothetical protein
MEQLKKDAESLADLDDQLKAENERYVSIPFPFVIQANAVLACSSPSAILSHR